VTGLTKQGSLRQRSHAVAANAIDAKRKTGKSLLLL